MNTQELQEEIGQWASRNFPITPAFSALIIAEEAGEVCRAVLKREDGIRGTYEEWTAELRKEVAEVFIALAKMAWAEGFDLQEAIEERWSIIKLRDWKKDPKGHGIINE
jgi:NTP pyrophosphatase (non-canonical NTP hydrolase)